MTGYSSLFSQGLPAGPATSLPSQTAVGPDLPDAGAGGGACRCHPDPGTGQGQFFPTKPAARLQSHPGSEAPGAGPAGAGEDGVIEHRRAVGTARVPPFAAP